MFFLYHQGKDPARAQYSTLLFFYYSSNSQDGFGYFDTVSLLLAQ
jgi:hypothetical protein